MDGWRVLNQYKAHYKHEGSLVVKISLRMGCIEQHLESKNEEPASPTALKPEINLKQYENRFK